MKTLLPLLCLPAFGLVGVSEIQAEVAKALTIQLDIPAPKDSGGGILVADVNNDLRPDYLVTVPGHLAVYDNDGTVPKFGDVALAHAWSVT